MQIGTGPFFPSPLYHFSYLLPKPRPFIFSSTKCQPSFQGNMRLKDKKERSNESVRKRKANGGEAEGSRRWVGKRVDGRGNKGWQAKVDSGKIGKRGLKGLLRDGNTFSDNDGGDDDGRKTKTVSDSAVFREIGDQQRWSGSNSMREASRKRLCRHPTANWFHQSSTTKDRSNGAWIGQVSLRHVERAPRRKSIQRDLRVLR